MFMLVSTVVVAPAAVIAPAAVVGQANLFVGVRIAAAAAVAGTHTVAVEEVFDASAVASGQTSSIHPGSVVAVVAVHQTDDDSADQDSSHDHNSSLPLQAHW